MENELEILWLASCRYCMGRRTYAVSEFCRLLCNNFHNISKDMRSLLLRDIKREIERHEELSGMGVAVLGDACDFIVWKDCYKTILEIEQNSGA